jgi:hypothetical protein
MSRATVARVQATARNVALFLALSGALAACGTGGDPAPGPGPSSQGGAAAGMPAGGLSGSAGQTSGATSGGSGGAAVSAGTGGAGNEAGGVAGAGGAVGGSGNGGASGSAGSGGAPPIDRHQRKLLLRDEGNSAVHYVDLADASKNWHQTVPVGRDLQLIGGKRFLLGTENGYQERNLSDGSVAKDVPGFTGTLDAHRLHNQNTLVVGVDFHGGKGIVLVEVTAAGTVARQLEYPGSYVRMVRETGDGHFLIAADTRVFEGDAQGKVVWEATVQGHAEPHAWKGLRLASGDVLVSAGYAASLQIFGADQQLKQTITGGDGVKPNFFADVQVMPGGSFVVANWQGHGTGLGGNGLQVVEYDSSGALIWSWKQDASFVSSLQQLVVMDGLDVDALHVESPMTGVLEPVN